MGDWKTIITIGREYGAGGRTVAKLLSEDKTYSEIEAVTKASTATISRINKCLVYGADGYKRILQRLADEDKD